jgi:hypothetical protein
MASHGLRRCGDRRSFNAIRSFHSPTAPATGKPLPSSHHPSAMSTPPPIPNHPSDVVRGLRFRGDPTLRGTHRPHPRELSRSAFFPPFVSSFIHRPAPIGGWWLPETDYFHVNQKVVSHHFVTDDHHALAESVPGRSHWAGCRKCDRRRLALVARIRRPAVRADGRT